MEGKEVSIPLQTSSTKINGRRLVKTAVAETFKSQVFQCDVGCFIRQNVNECRLFYGDSALQPNVFGGAACHHLEIAGFHNPMHIAIQ